MTRTKLARETRACPVCGKATGSNIYCSSNCLRQARNDKSDAGAPTPAEIAKQAAVIRAANMAAFSKPRGLSRHATHFQGMLSGIRVICTADLIRTAWQ